MSSFPALTSRCFFSGSDFDGENADELFYRLSAYGRDFHFNLTRNDRLTSPSLVVEFWSRDGAVRRPVEVTSRQCHYVGHISTEEATSSVAFSSCFGLVGYLASLAPDAREKSKVIDDGEFFTVCFECYSFVLLMADIFCMYQAEFVSGHFDVTDR